MGKGKRFYINRYIFVKLTVVKFLRIGRIAILYVHVEQILIELEFCLVFFISIVVIMQDFTRLNVNETFLP